MTLRTRELSGLTNAIGIDLSGLSSVFIDPVRALALCGPGARYSAIATEARKHNMILDLEPIAGIDFTLGDWAHESLRMLSGTSYGPEGTLRNIKVTSPATSFQTGFDNFAANGGGYDLTKMYLSSSLSLGVPYEFALLLRPVPVSVVERTYVFRKPGDAIRAGMLMHRSGYAGLTRVRSSGFDDMLTGESGRSSGSRENHLTVRIEGTQNIIEAAESALDEIATRESGKQKESESNPPTPISPDSVSSDVWVIGITLCDTLGVASTINDISIKAADAKRAFEYCISEITSNVSVLMPIVQGPPSDELLRSIGDYLVNYRIPLRGNARWNSLLGDSRIPPRMELIRGIKRFLDPHMILNPHVLGVI